MTYGDLVTEALKEIRAARAGDVPSPDDMADGVSILNRIIDFWNANQRTVYSEDFQDFTLVPSLSPHTIGPSGTFNITQRPVSIEFVSVNLGGSPAVYQPVTIRDDAWYANQPVPDLTMTFPTDVYYGASWPLGQLYFFGVPTVAYGVRIWMRLVLGAVAQTDDIALPPGYRQALTLSLAEEMANSFGQTVSASLERRARQARATVFHNNDDVPRISTRDSGLNMGGPVMSSFNWKNRSTR